MSDAPENDDPHLVDLFNKGGVAYRSGKPRRPARLSKAERDAWCDGWDRARELDQDQDDDLDG